MRPIDADAFKKYIDAQEGRPFIGCTVGEAMKILIDEQPTIQPEKAQLSQEGTTSDQPVATDTNVGNNSEIPNSSKGHWIFVHPLQEDDTGAYMCSECKVGNWKIDPERDFICPNCGAKMKGATP